MMSVLVRMVIMTALFIAAWMPLGYCQDQEQTNYRSGISMTFSGAEGTAYCEEYLFHDKEMNDRKIVYIRDDTKITMTHNAMNKTPDPGGSDSYVTGTGGTILYQVDHDLFGESADWQPGNSKLTYTAPFDFAGLQYHDHPGGAVKVVGTTGFSTGTGDYKAALTRDNQGVEYWRGYPGPCGDEWHVLYVGDYDDYGSTEFQASDGKYWTFVVNPKTPCLQVRAGTGGEFYTTPPKAYRIPKIHAQTTYFSGTCTFELTDINGNDVFYRINNGGWVQAANPTLDQDDFTDGTNTLDYYYAGNQAHTKTRTLVKLPVGSQAADSDFPGYVSGSGYMLCQSDAEYDEFTAIAKPGWWTDQYRRGKKGASETVIPGGRNRAYNVTPGGTIISTYLSILYGNEYTISGGLATTSYTAKRLLMAFQTIDPVGLRISHSNKRNPSREIMYRGYHDAMPAIESAFAYDILITRYRSTQHADGITPVEDYYIRDQLASYVVDVLGGQCGQGDPAYYYGDVAGGSGGMWDCARKCGSVAIMYALPNYSTPYYGTCGLDGNETVYEWTPMPNQPLTWKTIYVDEDYTLRYYPDLMNYGVGFDGANYLVNEDGNWTDRKGYYGTQLMGRSMQIAANLFVRKSAKRFPYYEKSLLRAVTGTLTGLKDGVTGYSSVMLCYNDYWPAAATDGIPYTLGLADDHADSDNKLAAYLAPYLPTWFLTSADSINAERVFNPIIFPAGGTFQGSRTVTLACATPGAVIRYTTDGSEPGAGSPEYSGALTLTTDATLKARAFGTGSNASGTVSAGFVIEQAGLADLLPVTPRLAGKDLVTVSPAPVRHQARFSLMKTFDGPIRIRNHQGEAVAEVPAVTRACTWDGTDPAGRPAAPGMYYYSFEYRGEIFCGRFIKTE